MKLKYERFEGLGCFMVREKVVSAHIKVFSLGLETLIKGLEETLLISLVNAEIDKNDALTLSEIKKRVSTLTDKKIIWVSKDRNFGDFPTIEIAISRLSVGGSKMKNIGDRIDLEENIFRLNHEIKIAEDELTQIAGKDDAVKKMIVENLSLKAQKSILADSLRWHNFRTQHQASIPAVDPTSAENLSTAIKEFNTAFGSEVDL